MSLDVVSHADDPLAPRKLLEARRASGDVIHVHEGHAADAPLLSRGQIVDEIELGVRLEWFTVCFDEEQRVDSIGVQSLKVFREKCALERRHLGQPRIVELPWTPKCTCGRSLGTRS